jgi:hypothetical protein
VFELLAVMAGHGPATHVFRSHHAAKTWVPGTRLGMTTEGGMTAREPSSRKERGAVIPDGAADPGSLEE